MEMEVIDIVSADTLRKGESIRWDGAEFDILLVVDPTNDKIVFAVEPRGVDGRDTIEIPWDARVELLGYVSVEA
jgi:hypothetical protein